GPTMSKAAGNVFLRGWLAQVFKVAAVTLAMEQQLSLGEAIDRLRTPAEASRLQAVLITIFQSPDVPEHDDDNSLSETEPRLRAKLREAFADAATLDVLATLAQQILVAPIDTSWDSWLR